MHTKASLALFIAFLVCASSTDMDEVENFPEDLNNLELDSLELANAVVPDASGKKILATLLCLTSHETFV